MKHKLEYNGKCANDVCETMLLLNKKKVFRGAGLPGLIDTPLKIPVFRATDCGEKGGTGTDLLKAMTENVRTKVATSGCLKVNPRGECSHCSFTPACCFDLELPSTFSARGVLAR